MPQKEIFLKKYFYLFFLILIIFSNTFSQNKPYLILFSFDAFRWDYTNRGLTPNFDSVKKHGVSSLSLRSVFPTKTFPNHFSIITGMYASNHGIIQNDFEDPFNSEWYSIWDSVAVKNPRWYLGEAFWETAERQGIKTASYFWPGSEMSLSYRHPCYFENYEHDRSYTTRIDGVINWLQLPYIERPHFITLYVDETDRMGHSFGPNSIEVNKAIQISDSLAGYLFSELKRINMLDSTNVIILSDHGMTEISNKRVINLEKIIGEKNKIQGNGPIMMIEPANSHLEDVYNKLKQNETHFKVYKKEDFPKCFHYTNHPFISSLIVIADLGWSLETNKSEQRMSKRPMAGNHGYDNNELDMQGIFFAIGPSFKSGYRTGTLWNIDIYPLLCKIFNIYPRQNIDGRLERIEFILK
jgi:predicted AlkP superfamily pyrophosphatase or phosphodiesterase